MSTGAAVPWAILAPWPWCLGCRWLATPQSEGWSCPSPGSTGRVGPVIAVCRHLVGSRDPSRGWWAGLVLRALRGEGLHRNALPGRKFQSHPGVPPGRLIELATSSARYGGWRGYAAQGSRTPFASPDGEQRGGLGWNPPHLRCSSRRVPSLEGLVEALVHRGACRCPVPWRAPALARGA